MKTTQSMNGDTPPTHVGSTSAVVLHHLPTGAHDPDTGRTAAVPSDLPARTTAAATTVVVPSHAAAAGAGVVRSQPLTNILALRDHREQLLDPKLAQSVQQFGGGPSGVPRTALHMPTLLSPLGPTDRTVFGDPDTAANHYWLGGGFQLAFTGVAPHRMKWVELRPEGNGCTLEAHLSLQAPQAPAGVRPMPATVRITTRCFLRATVRGMVREWDFTNVSIKDGVWSLALHVDGTDAIVAAQRDALYWAMTSSPDAKLIIRRSLSLATPIRIISSFPPVGIRLAGIERPMAATAPVADPHVAIWNGPPIHLEPRPVPLPPQYTVGMVAIDSAVDFVFDKALDGNVFAKLSPDVGTTASGWNHLKSAWQPDPGSPAVTHSYYQDRADPRAVYFLPDRFAIQRRPESPHKPWLRLTYLEGGTKVSLSYIAVPVWDQARIDAATADLVKQGIPRTHFPLQLFPAGTAALRLNLPRADPQGGPGYVPQPQANIDTTCAVHGAVTLLFDDFKPVFEGLVSDVNDLLAGSIGVTVDQDVTQIPFVARASQFTGDICDFTKTTGGPGSSITIVATNAIECSVEVPRLPVIFTRGGTRVAVQAGAATPALPATLAPGRTLTQTFTCREGSVDDLKFEADVSGLVVKPDPGAILDAILDPSLVGGASRDITFNVMTNAFTHTPPSGPPLVAVQLEFPGSSETLSFVEPTAPSPGQFVTQVFHWKMSLRDYLFGQLRGTAMQYTYRVRRIYGDGHQAVSGDQKDTRDVVYLQIAGSP